MSYLLRSQAGYSLMEIIVVVSILGIIVALPTGFLWGFGRSDALVAATREVISVMHEAHTSTISGRSVDGEQTVSYGIYFDPNYYVLFSGTSYNPNDANNARTDLPSGITFSQVQFPSDTLVFDKVTGKVANFNPSANFVEVQDDNTLDTTRITISQVGSIAYD